MYNNPTFGRAQQAHCPRAVLQHVEPLGHLYRLSGHVTTVELGGWDSGTTAPAIMAGILGSHVIPTLLSPLVHRPAAMLHLVPDGQQCNLSLQQTACEERESKREIVTERYIQRGETKLGWH